MTQRGGHAPATRWRIRIRRLLVAMLLLHILHGLYRLPAKAYPRRAQDLEVIAAEGFVKFILNRKPRTHKAVQWLLDHTPENAVVLYRATKSWQGDPELAAALLRPRIIYDESAVPLSATEVLGRPLARGQIDGQPEGVVVLVRVADHLRVERR